MDGPRSIHALSLVALLLLASCTEETAGSAAGPRVGPRFRERVAASVEGCARCHAEVVEQFLEHGMAYGLAPIEELPTGDVTQPHTGDRYHYEGDLLIHERPDGGRRVARVVGRYGAGVFDMSLIGCELDGEGRPTQRLVFLPLEDVRGHGAVLAPFESLHGGSGFDMPFTAECLSCHSTQDVSTLPGVAADSESGRIWPDNLLGEQAFEHLRPMACEACHGPTEAHAAAMTRASRERDFGADLELPRLSDLPAARQRDVCARCHLQGDGRIELAPFARSGPQPEDLLARRPVLIATTPSEDHPFVGQLQRLALSACFQAAADMTCNSCHDPHRSVAAQGTASFDARCQTCHAPSHAPSHTGSTGSTGSTSAASVCSRPNGLVVSDVTGSAARSAAGCVDCHVRRSQPFDLEHVVTADHWIRRRPARSGTPILRELENPDASLRVFDDGRLAERLATDEGQRWELGLVAVALARTGRAEQARPALEALPAAGSVTAATGQSAGLPALQRSADFQHLRALAHEALGELDSALAAYGRALSVDPSHPQAALNGAFLLHGKGAVQAALDEAGRLAARFPLAEKPWNLRYLAARSAGNPTYALSALAYSVERWPNDPTSWQALGRLLLETGARADARLAFDQAWRLQPSLPGLADDRAAAAP